MALTDVEQAVAFLYKKLLPAQETTVEAGEAIAALRAVRISNNQAFVAGGFAIPHGFTFAGAALGQACTVIQAGTVAGAVSGAAIGQRFWLTASGQATPTQPTTSGARLIRLGFAVSATDVFVEIEDLGTVP